MCCPKDGFVRCLLRQFFTAKDFQIMRHRTFPILLMLVVMAGVILCGCFSSPSGEGETTPTSAEENRREADMTPTSEPTVTAAPTPEPTATGTPTPEPAASDTPTPEPATTDTPTPEPAATGTPTPEITATDTPTPEPAATDTPTPEITATGTLTPEPTATATPIPGITVDPDSGEIWLPEIPF